MFAFAMQVFSSFQNPWVLLNLILSGKGQNVENHFIESKKKNIESLKFEKDQNVESIFRTSKVFWATTYGILPMCTKACGGLG